MSTMVAFIADYSLNPVVMDNVLANLLKLFSSDVFPIFFQR
jgi:hypothetical protein